MCKNCVPCILEQLISYYNYPISQWNKNRCLPNSTHPNIIWWCFIFLPNLKKKRLFGTALLFQNCEHTSHWYSGTSRNGHLSTTAISLLQPDFNFPKVHFYFIFDLSIAVTSLQQLLLCYPMGGCCRDCTV